MSIVSIVVDGVAVNPECLREFRTATGLPYLELTELISNRIPIFRKEIFDDQIDDVHAQIREIISIADTYGVALCIFEFPEGNHGESGMEDSCRISPQVLLNIIDMHRDEVVRQLQKQRQGF